VLLNQASRYGEAEHLATATLSSELTADEEAEIRLSLSMGSTHWPSRRVEENRRALQIPGISRDVRRLHLGWLAYNLVSAAEAGPVRETAEAALVAAAEDGDLEVRMLAEVALAGLECAEGYPLRCLQRLETMRPHLWNAEAGVGGMVGAVSAANLLITMGRIDDASAEIAEGLTMVRAVRNPAGEQVFLLMQALCAFAAGRLSEARSCIESLPADERLRTDRVAGRIGLLVMGAVAAHTDDRSMLHEVGIAARAALSGDAAVRREALGNLAHAAWQRGDDAEAARWLGEEFDLVTAPIWTMDLDHVVRAARVASASGDAGLRQRTLAAVDVLEREGRGSLFGAVAQHARGLLENDVDALEEAACSLADSSRPLLHAAAREDVGHAKARAGAQDHAVQQLNSAFDVFIAHEAVSDARRVAKALHRLGVHRRVVRQRHKSGWDSLTESELRVLELVADGATNREVARLLDVSAHTVNTHLRSVFAKLDVHSRAELSRLVRGDEA
jgi:DNA-binding CsgD family transcriptional regulator